MYRVTEKLLYSTIAGEVTMNNKGEDWVKDSTQVKPEFEIKGFFRSQINKIVAIRILELYIDEGKLTIEFDYKPDQKRKFTLEMQIVPDSNLSISDFSNFIDALFDILKEKIVFETIEENGEKGVITLDELIKIADNYSNSEFNNEGERWIIAFYKNDTLSKKIIIRRIIKVKDIMLYLYLFDKLNKLTDKSE